MDINELKTLVAVAHDGSMMRAAQQLNLSQPDIQAHIKAMEEELGLTLFERTAQGMCLTLGGQQIVVKAEQTLGAHQQLLDEAVRLKRHLVGTLRLGAGNTTSKEPLGHLLGKLSERCPDVEVSLRHGTSQDTLTGIRAGTLDAGYYIEPGEPNADLLTVEVSRFDIFLVARPGLVDLSGPVDWQALAEVPWIYPAQTPCCANTAETLFARHAFRPKRIISVDRESVTRSLVASGVGIGLLHGGAAQEAEARGEAQILCDACKAVRVLFAHLASRTHDPVLEAARAFVREDADPVRSSGQS